MRGKGKWDHLPIVEVMEKLDGEKNDFDKLRIKNALAEIEAAKDPGAITITVSTLKGAAMGLFGKAKKLGQATVQLGHEQYMTDRITNLKKVAEDREEAKKLLDKGEISPKEYGDFIDELDVKELILNRE